MKSKKKILHCDYNPNDRKYYCSTITEYGLLYPNECEYIITHEELYNYIKDNSDLYIYELPFLVAHEFRKTIEFNKKGKKK